MICLSLAQPFSSLLITGVKTWETRGWKPSPRSMKLIEKDGLLVHASLSKRFSHLMGEPPFSKHLQTLGRLEYGSILGSCRVGRIIRTEDWMKANMWPGMPKGLWHDEYFFGDYGAGRWAWQITDVVRFDEPIPAKGRLALWQSPWPLPKKHLQLI